MADDFENMSFASTGDPAKDFEIAESIRRSSKRMTEGICANGCAPMIPSGTNSRYCPVCHYFYERTGHQIPAIENFDGFVAFNQEDFNFIARAIANPYEYKVKMLATGIGGTNLEYEKGLFSPATSVWKYLENFCMQNGASISLIKIEFIAVRKEE